MMTLDAECGYAECSKQAHHAERRNPERHYSERRLAECHGANVSVFDNYWINFLSNSIKKRVGVSMYFCCLS
jgi:hypothetical protein